MDEDNQKGQGGVEEATGKAVPKSKVAPLDPSRSRMHLVGIDGGRKVEEADKRLDEFAAFWEEFGNDFDR